MIKNLKIFETGKKYGNMNTNKAFYPEKLTVADRKAIFQIRRNRLGEDLGFDGHKFFMADQQDKRGTWFEIDEEYVEANPNGWSDIRQDILVVTEKTPGVVIGHPVADCPVVMAYDNTKGVVAIGHCSAELVDKKMPMLVCDALYNSYRSKDEDITTYVSACAGDSWTYDRYPAWAKDDKIWSEAITEENGLFKIDLKKAVFKQLKERNIKEGNITISPVDTITDEGFYSNSAARTNKTKAGRNFAGAFFEETAKVKTKTR